MSHSTSDAHHPTSPLALGGAGTGARLDGFVRVPLIVNAEDHLDSDLAVDGLTLIDALHGQWRWHYPGTPHMGILPLFFSYPQAAHLGSRRRSPLSAAGLDLALDRDGRRSGWRGGRMVLRSRAGPIVPLCVLQPGTIWLSGRITGGHLLTLVWHILAFARTARLPEQGGGLRRPHWGFGADWDSIST